MTNKYLQYLLINNNLLTYLWWFKNMEKNILGDPGAMSEMM